MFWNQILSQLEQDLGHKSVDHWLRPLKLLRFDAANLYLEAQDQFQIHWFEEHVRPRIKHLSNPNGRPLKIHLSLPSQPLPQSNPQRTHPLPTKVLDPEMTLEHFIPSPNNQMVLNIISKDIPFNPIFLYGPKGCGKTHLLMAISAFFQNLHKTVCYVHADKFTEQVVLAMQQGSMKPLRTTYRSADVLLIDDIHFLARKNATQEEFFHTFNELHTRGSIIFLSSRQAPSQLIDIEPRLISRFEWGISIGLEKIDPALILKKKATLWNLSLHETLIPFLIKTFPSSALNALQTLALRAVKHPLPIDPKLAIKLLPDLLQQETLDAWTAEKIIKTISIHYGIASADLLGKSQTREIAIPRQIAMYLCREKLKLSFQKIGQLFGRDHSTVMTSVKQIQKLIDEKKQDISEVVAAFF